MSGGRRYPSQKLAALRRRPAAAAARAAPGSPPAGLGPVRHPVAPVAQSAGVSSRPATAPPRRSHAPSPPSNRQLKDIKSDLESIKIALGVNTYEMANAIETIKANKVLHPDNLACKLFDMEYYNSLNLEDKKALLRIVNSGVVNGDSGMGCYAMNPTEYDKFFPFFNAVIKVRPNFLRESFPSAAPRSLPPSLPPSPLLLPRPTTRSTARCTT